MKLNIAIITLITVLTGSFAFSNTLGLEENSDGTWNVNYSSDGDIAGFQFNVDGTTVSGAHGGDAEVAGFQLSASSTTVLGFSLTGAVIPAGCGTLVMLYLDGVATGLSNIVMSDTNGQSIPFEYYVIAFGCVDEGACNYDPNADYDDGSCVYDNEIVDCNGDCYEDEDGDGICDQNDDCVGSLDCENVCNGMAVEDCAGVCGGDAVLSGCDNACNSTAVEDCAGVCGGDAVLSGCDNLCGSTAVDDCSGVCDGSAVEDCAGACDGTAVVDCAGTCNGDAVADACGLCNGTEIDPNNCFDNTTLWISNIVVDEDADFPECLQDCEGWEYWVDANAEEEATNFCNWVTDIFGGTCPDDCQDPEVTDVLDQLPDIDADSFYGSWGHGSKLVRCVASLLPSGGRGRLVSRSSKTDGSRLRSV